MTIKMKQLLILIVACLLWPLGAFAQYEEDTENGVVSLAGKEGFPSPRRKGILYLNLTFWYRQVLV